jgi:hypothetical protein
MKTVEITSGAKNASPHVLYFNGTVALTDDELVTLVRSAGTATLFEDRLREATVAHLSREDHMPKSFDIMACVMSVVPSTELRTWGFSIVAVSRFSS